MNTELDKLIGLLEKGRECKPCQKRLQAAGVATAARTLAELAALGLLAGTALILSQLGRNDLAQLVRNWSPVSNTEISEEDRAQILWASTWAQQDAARGVVSAWDTQVEGIGWNPVADMAMADEAWEEATTISSASADPGSDPCQWLKRNLEIATQSFNRLTKAGGVAAAEQRFSDAMSFTGVTMAPMKTNFTTSYTIPSLARDISKFRLAILKYCTADPRFDAEGQDKLDNLPFR